MVKRNYTRKGRVPYYARRSQRNKRITRRNKTRKNKSMIFKQSITKSERTARHTHKARGGTIPSYLQNSIKETVNKLCMEYAISKTKCKKRNNNDKIFNGLENGLENDDSTMVIINTVFPQIDWETTNVPEGHSDKYGSAVWNELKKKIEQCRCFLIFLRDTPSVDKGIQAFNALQTQTLAKSGFDYNRLQTQINKIIASEDDIAPKDNIESITIGELQTKLSTFCTKHEIDEELYAQFLSTQKNIICNTGLQSVREQEKSLLQSIKDNKETFIKSVREVEKYIHRNHASISRKALSFSSTSLQTFDENKQTKLIKCLLRAIVSKDKMDEQDLGKYVQKEFSEFSNTNFTSQDNKLWTPIYDNYVTLCTNYTMASCYNFNLPSIFTDSNFLDTFITEKENVIENFQKTIQNLQTEIEKLKEKMNNEHYTTYIAVADELKLIFKASSENIIASAIQPEIRSVLRSIFYNAKCYDAAFMFSKRESNDRSLQAETASNAGT